MGEGEKSALFTIREGKKKIRERRNGTYGTVEIGRLECSTVGRSGNSRSIRKWSSDYISLTVSGD